MAKKRPSGDGMIRKKNNSWEARIVVGHNNDGSPIFRYVYAKTQKELNQKLFMKKQEYFGVELTEESNMTVKEWLDKWLEKYASISVRERTWKKYKSLINIHIIPNIGDKPVSYLTSSDIQKMYAKLKSNGRVKYHPVYKKELSDGSILEIHRMLHKSFEDAVREGIVPNNPTNNTNPPKVRKKEMQILNDEQLGKFIKAIEKDDLWHDIFYTEMTTGLRRGEICGLKWSDFNEYEGSLHINRSLITVTNGEIIQSLPKTKDSIRKIYLPESTKDLLLGRKIKSKSEWIFENPLEPTLPITPNSVYRQLKKILRNEDLPMIRFHDLRHTFATHALSSGVDAKTLSKILGHTQASFTLDTYTHVTTDMQKKAAEIVDNFVEDILGKELELLG